MKEKTHQPLTTPRKALNPLQNTNRQSQQVTSQAKPTVSITTKPSAQKPSQQNIKSSKKASKTKPAPTNPEHDNKEEYPEIENIHITDPLKSKWCVLYKNVVKVCNSGTGRFTIHYTGLHLQLKKLDAKTVQLSQEGTAQ